jgi:hypothetical protein
MVTFRRVQFITLWRLNTHTTGPRAQGTQDGFKSLAQRARLAQSVERQVLNLGILRAYERVPKGSNQNRFD